MGHSGSNRAIDARWADESESSVLLCNSPNSRRKCILPATRHRSARTGIQHGAAQRPVKRIPHSTLPASSVIEQVDELDTCCAQAIAIAALLMEADAGSAIQDAACAIRMLIERARRISESLYHHSHRLG